MQVFVDTATLERFVGLRLSYLVFILSSAISCVPELKVLDCKPDFRAMMQLLNEEWTRSSFDIKRVSTLVSFDVRLSMDDWSDKWSYVLARSSSREELETIIYEQSNISPPGGVSLEATKKKLTGDIQRETVQPPQPEPAQQNSEGQQGTLPAMH